MEINEVQKSSDLFEAQSHLYKHIFNFIDSMCLKSAVELGIPDIIHGHGKPIILPDLVSALHIDPSKSNQVRRLMRLLVHSGFFSATKTASEEENQEDAFDLTPSSKLLLRDKFPTLSPYVLAMFHPALVHPFEFLGDWFHKDEDSPFHIANGMGFGEFANQNREFNKVFNEAMVSDSGMMNLVIKDCKSVFEGLDSLVDVGGGKGAAAKIISEACPDLKCTVLDLPRVVENLSDSSNLRFVGGDMFLSILWLMPFF